MCNNANCSAIQRHHDFFIRFSFNLQKQRNLLKEKTLQMQFRVLVWSKHRVWRQLNQLNRYAKSLKKKYLRGQMTKIDECSAKNNGMPVCVPKRTINVPAVSKSVHQSRNLNALNATRYTAEQITSNGINQFTLANGSSVVTVKRHTAEQTTELATNEHNIEMLNKSRKQALSFFLLEKKL